MELKSSGIIVAGFVAFLVAVAVWTINSNTELLNQSISQISSMDASIGQQKNLIIKKLTKKLQAAEKEIAQLKRSAATV